MMVRKGMAMSAQRQIKSAGAGAAPAPSAPQRGRYNPARGIRASPQNIGPARGRAALANPHADSLPADRAGDRQHPRPLRSGAHLHPGGLAALVAIVCGSVGAQTFARPAGGGSGGFGIGGVRPGGPAKLASTAGWVEVCLAAAHTAAKFGFLRLNQQPQPAKAVPTRPNSFFPEKTIIFPPRHVRRAGRSNLG